MCVCVCVCVCVCLFVCVYFFRCIPFFKNLFLILALPIEPVHTIFRMLWYRYKKSSTLVVSIISTWFYRIWRIVLVLLLRWHCYTTMKLLQRYVLYCLLSLSLSLSLFHTHAYTHSHTHKITHQDTHIHIHAQTHTQTHEHSCFFSSHFIISVPNIHVPVDETHKIYPMDKIL